MENKTIGNFFQGSRAMRYLLAALILLMVADALITKFLVGSGLGHEGNIFLKNVVGQDTFILLKAGGAMVCALLLWDMHRRWYKLAFTSTICFVTVYSGIVGWNLYVLVSMGSQVSLSVISSGTFQNLFCCSRSTLFNGSISADGPLCLMFTRRSSSA